MYIVIDFDGTCVTHEFPKIGKDIGAAPVLKDLVAKGHKLILFTMRSDIVNPKGGDGEIHLESGNYLTEALQWFKDNDIPLFGVQSNPTQHTWTTSPKAYGELIIDDAALGCPLTGDANKSLRMFVDWAAVKDILFEKGLINP